MSLSSPKTAARHLTYYDDYESPPPDPPPPPDDLDTELPSCPDPDFEEDDIPW